MYKQLMSIAAAYFTALLLVATPAPAFVCYIGESPESFVTLHELPSESSRIVARLEPFNMVGAVPAVDENDTWVFVRWSRDQSSQDAFARGEADGAGWIKRDHIRGECED